MDDDAMYISDKLQASLLDNIYPGKRFWNMHMVISLYPSYSYDIGI